MNKTKTTESLNSLTTMQLYIYLNKRGLADQVHIYTNDDGFVELVFYHWNQIGSSLTPTMKVFKNRIEHVYYPRAMIPMIYKLINIEIVNNFDLEKHKFLRDKR
jgi:hypothetical protein